MNRQPGYYWVIANEDWIIARWFTGLWFVAGQIQPRIDSELGQINETRIPTPNEQDDYINDVDGTRLSDVK